MLAAHALTVFDVAEFETHGGSLRLYARHAADGSKPVLPRTEELLAEERRKGLERLETYAAFA